MLRNDNDSPKRNNADKPYENVKIALTSGTLIKLEAWRNIGLFNELLFVDEVDHEFCYRLRSEDYNIVKVNGVFMNHKIGRHKGLRKI